MNNKIKKASRHTNQSEGLIFEKSSPGKRAFELPPLDVPAADPAKALGANHRRAGIEGFPEVSEIEVLRHFTRLSTWNYAIDLGMYPLGSCTMKYNPRVNEFVARLDGIATEHPYQPQELSQGCLKIMRLLEQCLLEITGMDALTLQPAAGAHGEMTGLLLIRAYLAKQGNPRKKVLIPDSAHGTNPATAVIAGYEVENIKSESHGVGNIRAAHSRDRGNSACQGRAALHGRRKHERADGRDTSGRPGRRRNASEFAQNVFHAARRRRPRRRSGSDEENPRTVPAGAHPGGKRRRASSA